ncbi:helix-turn-helix domain-containing protein [Intestinimonas butyriciproducens]|uniref:helix-turn-helix domain-containing protein n=1 Tax=Intestinimonas butyriciproducens TaxID=1297617 RepID=UPI0018A0B156
MNLIEKVREHLKTGINTTPPFLHLFRYTSKTIPMPQVETLYIYFVLDGEFRLYTPGGMLDYVAGQYSVSAIDTPEKGYVLAFSEQQDFLAASVDFTANDVMSAIIALNDDLTMQILDNTLNDEFKAKQDQCVLSCLERILDMLVEPVSMKFLCEQIRAEMIFHILCGSCGKAFIQSITNVKSAGEIYEANSWIKQNYRQSFKIEELAEQWNMSVSQFHQKFKNAVGMGPLQCQKRLRLTEARRLMLDEGKKATEAAFDVGYESLSQFTREYRKMFGSSPTEDIQFLQRVQKK